MWCYDISSGVTVLVGNRINPDKEIWCCNLCPATWDPGWELKQRQENYMRMLYHIGLEHPLTESISTLLMLGQAYNTIVKRRCEIKEKRKKGGFDYSLVVVDED